MATPSTGTMKDKLFNDFNSVIGEVEQVLKSVAFGTGDKADALRSAALENLRIAKERLEDLQEVVFEKTRLAARAADDYVHDYPWRAVGVAAGLGLAVGLLINRR